MCVDRLGLDADELSVDLLEDAVLVRLWLRKSRDVNLLTSIVARFLVASRGSLTVGKPWLECKYIGWRVQGRSGREERCGDSTSNETVDAMFTGGKRQCREPECHAVVCW